MTNIRTIRRALLAMTAVVPLLSCGIVRLTGDTVVLAGKVTTTAVKTGGAVVATTSKVGDATVRRFTGRKTIRLQRQGQAYYVNVRVNRRRDIRLLLDTGATSMQIPAHHARQLGLDLSRAEVVRCQLADGSFVNAHAVILKEVKIGSVEVDDVKALVFEQGGDEGLLGMSFLKHFNFQVDTVNDVLILQQR